MSPCAVWEQNKPRNSLLVSHVDAPCINWGRQSCCLVRKESMAAIHSLHSNSTHAQSIRQRQKNTLSLRWCELSSTSGGRRRSREEEDGHSPWRPGRASLPFIKIGWPLADFNEEFWIAHASFFFLLCALEMSVLVDLECGFHFLPVTAFLWRIWKDRNFHGLDKGFSALAR